MRSPLPNTPIGSHDGSYGLSPNPQTSTHVFHSSHSSMIPMNISTPQSARRRILVNLSTPQSLSKDFIFLGGLDKSSDQSRGRNKVGSIVSRLYANYIPPLRFRYYVPKNKRNKVINPDPKYCLSPAEKSCLDELWMRLYSK